MKDKVPSKITGFLISVIGTGVILRFLSVIIDRFFLFNSEFTLKDYEDLRLVIFIISIFIGILWLYRIKNISD